MLVGGGRWARAQITGAPSRYAPLTRPVRIPLDSVTTPWRPVSFTAEAMTVPPLGHDCGFDRPKRGREKSGGECQIQDGAPGNTRLISGRDAATDHGRNRDGSRARPSRAEDRHPLVDHQTERHPQGRVRVVTPLERARKRPSDVLHQGAPAPETASGPSVAPTSIMLAGALRGLRTRGCPRRQGEGR